MQKIKQIITIIISFCSVIMTYGQTTYLPALWFRISQDSILLQNINRNAADDISTESLSSKLRKSSINAYPAIEFDSISGHFSFTTDSLNGAKQFVVMVVYQSEKPDSMLGIWSLRNTDKKSFYLTGNKIGNANSQISYNIFDEQGVIVNTSVFVVDKKATEIEGSDSLRIGSANNLEFKGKIAEFIVFKNNVSKNERRQWQTYLSLKYASTMRYDDYISSWGDTLWCYKENEAYSKGIAGLGRDDYFGLNQHQSHAAEDSLAIGIDGIYLQHKNVLKDKDFLMWGHNGGALSPDGLSYYYQDSIPIEIEARKWMVKSHFISNIIYPTVVQRSFDTEENAAKACLLINPSEYFGTWLNNTEIYLPDSISENKAFFKNIIWNVDGRDRNYFAFGYTKDNTLLNDPKSKNTISEIKKVFTEASWQPNPVVDNLYVSYKLTRDAKIWFTVHNNVGVPVCQVAPSNKKTGYNETIISMGHLIRGSYTVYIHVDDMVMAQTVIKK